MQFITSMRGQVRLLKNKLIQYVRQKRENSRAKKILFGIDASRFGLEIGPSHRPVAPKRNGFKVKTLDHLSAEGLRDKYRTHNVDINAIEEVDYIWSGEPISQLVGEGQYNWIIASHVIEHVPDLIGFINECEKALTDLGVLSLAVPDKRYCFDHFREHSSLSRIIDAHISQNFLHTQGTAAEYYLNVCKKGGVIAWIKGYPGQFEFVHGLNDAISAMQRIEAGDYIDLHAWCFTPSGFRLLINDLAALGYIRMKEKIFFNTFGHEFYITLSKDASGCPIDRMKLLKLKQAELRVGG